MSATVDVAVVGAGASGLAAAHALRAGGVRVMVIEAKDRLGGRAYTDRASIGVPFDHGCYWMHAARINPYVRIADMLGFRYRRSGQRWARRIFMAGEGRWASGPELRAWRRFEARTTATVEAAGRAGVDAPVVAFTERRARWTSLFDAWTAATSGVTPEHGSTLDFGRYYEGGANWPVRDGFGALIAAHGRGLPVRLGCPVTAIDWRGRTVSLATPHGTLAARAVIVTASTAVLGAGRIRFAPALPDWKRSAIEALPLGMANKVALAFDRDVFGLGANASTQVLADSAETMGFQLRPWGRNMAVGHVGGAFCSALERAGEAAMIDFAMECLTAMFGAGIRGRLASAAATGWQGDAWIGGGYSAAKPGAGAPRADLARPLAGRLFFAGEAASVPYYSTAHGAYFAGADAARQAIAAIGSR